MLERADPQQPQTNGFTTDRPFDRESRGGEQVRDEIGAGSNLVAGRVEQRAHRQPAVIVARCWRRDPLRNPEGDGPDSAALRGDPGRKVGLGNSAGGKGAQDTVLDVVEARAGKVARGIRVSGVNKRARPVDRLERSKVGSVHTITDLDRIAGRTGDHRVEAAVLIRLDKILSRVGQAGDHYKGSRRHGAGGAGHSSAAVGGRGPHGDQRGDRGGSVHNVHDGNPATVLRQCRVWHGEHKCENRCSA